jgi:Domain of unknown function (DUF1816)
MKEVLLSALERIGMAWWVEITTATPQCTYYFGPFLSSDEAIAHQPGYLEDLHTEGAHDIHAHVKRCRPIQLTVSDLEANPSKPVVNAI